jgi:hypothetical protein
MVLDKMLNDIYNMLPEEEQEGANAISTLRLLF